jgi:hypothetical protein
VDVTFEVRVLINCCEFLNLVTFCLASDVRYCVRFAWIVRSSGHVLIEFLIEFLITFLEAFDEPFCAFSRRIAAQFLNLHRCSIHCLHSIFIFSRESRFGRFSSFW